MARPSDESNSELPVIGWRERVSLPDWGVRNLRAKADTGAKTSAIDVARLEEVKGNRVRFDVVVDRSHPERYLTVEAPIVRKTRVRSSIGRSRERIIVKTTLAVGKLRRVIEIGLVCRHRMICRMLIGRSALSGWCTVDPSRRYLLSSPRSARGHGS